MRDPERIDEFCNELAKIWHQHSDMRFGQFMMNVLGEMGFKHGDPFFWEEDRFMEYLKEIPWIKSK